MGATKNSLVPDQLDTSSVVQKANRTHASDAANLTLLNHVEVLKNRIRLRGDLPHVLVERQLGVVDDLLSFPFGRYLLDRRGANAYWTDFLINYPSLDPCLGHQVVQTPGSPTEDFLLNRAPVVVAHRERFQIYQTLTQPLVKPDVVLASVPCGLMRDLLTLDYSAAPGAELYGIDIDLDALQLARFLVETQGMDNVTLLQMDAWSLPYENKFDVMNSSGLNVYESDREQVVNLYRSFHKSLKPGGYLVTSVLTYPPTCDGFSDWNIAEFSAEDLLFERILFQDVLDLKWRNFRSVSELTRDFEKAGFSSVSVHFDHYRVFPTIMARK